MYVLYELYVYKCIEKNRKCTDHTAVFTHEVGISEKIF